MDESLQDKVLRHRREVATERWSEQILRDSTRERETRSCTYPGCGMPFYVPPGSKRTKCLNHFG